MCKSSAVAPAYFPLKVSKSTNKYLIVSIGQSPTLFKNKFPGKPEGFLPSYGENVVQVNSNLSSNLC